MTRRESREQAFILVFEKIFNAELSFEEIAEAALAADSHRPDAFAAELAEKVYENLEEIDAVIASNSRGWKLERLSRVALAILRLAICEIKFYDDIPVSVSINEAVELTKIYGTDDSPGFVNGVLGRVAAKIEKENKALVRKPDEN